MAKKARHRVWWYPVFEAEKKTLENNGSIGPKNEDQDECPILFDNYSDAYALAASTRMPIKMENGERVVNDQGYAQLENLGRITLIGFRGKRMDWKQIKKLPPADGMKGEAIALVYQQSAKSYYVEQVLEETDEMYLNQINSPLARAGGIVPPADLIKKVEEAHATPTNEDVLPETEQGAGDEHADQLEGAGDDRGASEPAAVSVDADGSAGSVSESGYASDTGSSDSSSSSSGE